MTVLTQGQGHKVKDQGPIYVFLYNDSFGFKPWPDE